AKVERIVENLLANAARHTPPASRVWVTVRRKDDGVLLTVDDEGDGVPTDLREAVFEPFRQGPGPSEHSPGVGVGLSLVARFAELHGGSAWVEDRPGRGASFRVYLPER
ncbi:MAG TPA: ATP-binding protein, partial [Actinomycetota bacterium]|nr:ATP-binding protein [Actinomycetota bacterium]